MWLLWSFSTVFCFCFVLQYNSMFTWKCFSPISPNCTIRIVWLLRLRYSTSNKTNLTNTQNFLRSNSVQMIISVTYKHNVVRWLSEQCCQRAFTNFTLWPKAIHHFSQTFLNSFPCFGVDCACCHTKITHRELRSGSVNIWGIPYQQMSKDTEMLLCFISPTSRGCEFCFLKAGYRNPRGPCYAEVVPGVNVLSEMCVFIRVIPLDMLTCMLMYSCAPYCVALWLSVQDGNSTNSSAVSVGCLPGSADLQLVAL